MSYSSLVTAINNFVNEVKVLVAKKPASALVSDNTNLLGGQTSTQISQSAQTRVNNHANDKANPHAVTAAQLGGVTTAYVDQFLESRLTLGSLAISRYGNINDSDIGITVSGKTVNFTKQNPAFIRGQSRIFQPFTMDIEDTTTVNRVYHVYLIISEGDVVHEITQEVIPETLETMYLGSIRFDANDNVQYSGFKPIARVGISRISEVACGSGIPATSGLPNVPAKLDPDWR